MVKMWVSIDIYRNIICTYWLCGRARHENIWLEVRASWPRAKYFPVRPNLTQSISMLSYDHFFFIFIFLVERGHAGPYAFLSKAVRVFLTLSPTVCLLRELFSYGFPRKLCAGPCGLQYIIKTLCTITYTTGLLISLCLHWYKLS